MDGKRPLAYVEIRDQVRQLLASRQLQQALKSADKARRDAAMNELGLADEDARLELINLLNDLDRHSATRQPPVPAETRQMSDIDREPRAIGEAEAFFAEAFRQLRTAYRLSLSMSGAIFAVGLLFLLLAAYQAVTQPQAAAAAAVVGGVGIVQIVALFYRNPLADIARAVANAQRAKIELTSYLIGITLIHRSIGDGAPTDEHLLQLALVTDRAMTSLGAPPRPQGSTERAGTSTD